MHIVIVIQLGVNTNIQDGVYRNIIIRDWVWVKESTLPTLILIKKINMDY